MSEDSDAVILSACRTPIGSFGGVFKDLTAPDLGAVVVREAIARAGVNAADVGDVILGCVLQAGAGMNVARQAALKAGVPVEVPAETVNRVCGSGLQAVVHASRARAATPAHVGRVVLDIAHALDAAGHDDIGRAGLHHHRGRRDRLQAAAAAAIQLHARDLDRKARLQRGR